MATDPWGGAPESRGSVETEAGNGSDPCGRRAAGSRDPGPGPVRSDFMALSKLFGRFRLKSSM